MEAIYTYCSLRKENNASRGLQRYEFLSLNLFNYSFRAGGNWEMTEVYTLLMYADHATNNAPFVLLKTHGKEVVNTTKKPGERGLSLKKNVTILLILYSGIRF